MKSTRATKFTEGSNDALADLGFSPSESSNLRLRGQMITALREFIEKENLPKPQPQSFSK